MGKCNSYYKEFGKERCYGTKEMEECSCGGDEAKCNFYPTKRIEAIGKDEVTDIFTLLQKIWKTGYEITFKPDALYRGNVIIKLTDPRANKYIITCMWVDQKYINDFNGAIFDQINAIIANMDKHREETYVL